MDQWERDSRTAQAIIDFIWEHDVIYYADLVDLIMDMTGGEEAEEWFGIVTGEPEFFIEYLASRARRASRAVQLS